MKHKFFSFFAALIALFAFSSFTIAQDAAQDNRREFKRGFGGHKMRGLQQLNLTDAQREQIRALMENFKNSTQTQHQELRQIQQQKRSGTALTAEQEARASQLKEQLRAARQKQHADLLAILTPEQRAEIEKAQAERKERRRGGSGIGDGFGRRSFGKGFGGGMRSFGGINLTEAQQQQARQIMEANRNSTQTQREEMRQILSQRRSGNVLTAQQKTRLKELSDQLRASQEKLQNDLSAILTAEQRRQIEQRREEMRKRKEERRQQRQNVQPTIN